MIDYIAPEVALPIAAALVIVHLLQLRHERKVGR